MSDHWFAAGAMVLSRVSQDSDMSQSSLLTPITPSVMSRISCNNVVVMMITLLTFQQSVVIPLCLSRVSPRDLSQL